MKVQAIIQALESWAPPQYAESYDNVGLIVGDSDQEVTGVLVTLDSIESVIDEAIEIGLNMIIAHHPILFKGLKKINGATYVERAVIKAIKHDISIYALHTNLDNIITGVNSKIADILGLQDQKILAKKDSITMSIGSGIIGQLAQPVTALQFLQEVKSKMGLGVIKHTSLLENPIHTIALCGGSGSFLIPEAIKAGADVFITSDLKYHEYFDADGKILLMDIGHYESERYTSELIQHYLQKNLNGLLVRQTSLTTNPVQYFV